MVGYSVKGDLTKYFDGYFDTTVGLKVEKESYDNIAKEIGVAPSKILFVSDNIKGERLVSILQPARSRKSIHTFCCI